MADFVKGLFGGAKSAASSASAAADDAFADFADYATAASPSAPSHAASFAGSSSPASPTGGFGPGIGLMGRPYTKWYRVWERAQLSDFYQEAFIIPLLLLAIGVHLWGTSTNRRKAKAWVRAHAPVLNQEFASVGFGGEVGTLGEVDSKSGATSVKPEVLKEKKASEYTAYCTGRQNVAFLDIKITLAKRYNPLILIGEEILGFFFESLPAPKERLEATAYAFDGKEKEMNLGGESKVQNSEYDGFVWAIVHKDLMKQLRNDRYDISLTTTKDHPKLPPWVTVMSEAAEVTETLLTPELVKAIEQAGDDFEGLIITDQPIDQPKKLNETIPRKRVSLSLKLPSSTSADAYNASQALFTYFVRIPDQLVKEAHWRPEVKRRINQTREDEIKKIRKVDETEREEQLKTDRDRKKKEEREAKLKGLTADQQRKFLEKEREKDQRKAQKKRTMKA